MSDLISASRTLDARDQLYVQLQTELSPFQHRYDTELIERASFLSQVYVGQALQLAPVDIALLNLEARANTGGNSHNKPAASEATIGIAGEMQPAFVVLSAIHILQRHLKTGDLYQRLAQGFGHIANTINATSEDSKLIALANENALSAIEEFADPEVNDTEKILEIFRDPYLSDKVRRKAKIALLGMRDYRSKRTENDPTDAELFDQLYGEFNELAVSGKIHENESYVKEMVSFVDSASSSHLDRYDLIIEMLSTAIGNHPRSFENSRLTWSYAEAMANAIQKGSKMLDDEPKTLSRIKDSGTLDLYIVDLKAKYDLTTARLKERSKTATTETDESTNLTTEEQTSPENQPQNQEPFYKVALRVITQVKLKEDDYNYSSKSFYDFEEILLEDIARHNDITSFRIFEGLRPKENYKDIFFTKLVECGDIDVACSFLPYILKSRDKAELLIAFSNAAMISGRKDLCELALRHANSKTLISDLQRILINANRDDLSGIISNFEDHSVPAITRLQNYLQFISENPEVEIPETTIINMVKFAEKGTGSSEAFKAIAKIGFTSESLPIILEVFPKLGDDTRIKALLIARSTHPDWVESMLSASNAKTKKAYYSVLGEFGQQ